MMDHVVNFTVYGRRTRAEIEQVVYERMAEYLDCDVSQLPDRINYMIDADLNSLEANVTVWMDGE